jgi:hypothetical protein
MIVGIALGAWCLASLPLGIGVGKLLARRATAEPIAARPLREMPAPRRETVAAR